MKRIDYVSLRKRAGMSQRQLADILQVRPSFLSAIENGRSRMPDEKLERLKEIFELENLDAYIIEDDKDVNSSHSHIMEPEDTITSILNHFHDLAHQREKATHGNDSEVAERIDYLTRRNDRLSERVDDLREEVDRLRSELLRLKELLIKNGIPY